MANDGLFVHFVQNEQKGHSIRKTTTGEFKYVRLAKLNLILIRFHLAQFTAQLLQIR